MNVSPSVADFTSLALMQPTLKGRDCPSIVTEMSTVLRREGFIADQQVLIEAVIKREAMISTVVPPCWAMPHARINGPSRIVFTVGRTPRPVQWGEANQLVQQVFLFVVPDNDFTSYMLLLSDLARLSQDKRASDQLLAATDAGTMFQFLQRVPLRSGTPVSVGGK